MALTKYFIFSESAKENAKEKHITYIYNTIYKHNKKPLARDKKNVF